MQIFYRLVGISYLEKFFGFIILFLGLGRVRGSINFITFKGELATWDGGSYELVFGARSLRRGIAACVCLITFYVSRFSLDYIRRNIFRLIILVDLFCWSMILLLFSKRLFSFILGWDGLGLSSYLLVCYYQNCSSSSAGTYTLLINRLGDIFIILCILLSFGYRGQSCPFSKVPYLGLALVIASCTKRAQYPFNTWLPLAISAPTPVSALVHSSTLVAGGALLIIEFFPCTTKGDLRYLYCASSIRVLIGRLGASSEKDVKKLVAYSTLRQIRIVMLGVSLGLVESSFFHLLRHAFTKASLFIAVGFGIKHMGQDLRNCRGVDYSIPVVGACLDFSTSILAGIPFLRGFFAKDYFLEGALRGEISFIGGLINFISVRLTGSYCGILMRDFVGYRPTSSSCFNSSRKGRLCFPLLLLPGIFLGPMFESRESGLVAVRWLESIFLGRLRALLYLRSRRSSYFYRPKSQRTFFVNIFLGTYIVGFASRKFVYKISKDIGKYGEIGWFDLGISVKENLIGFYGDHKKKIAEGGLKVNRSYSATIITIFIIIYVLKM